MRGFQVGGPSLYDFEAEMRSIKVPTLLVVGDEDDPCLEPSLLLKQWIKTSGLVVFPKTGHVVNQEEPALFNDAVADFIARVEAGRWPARDPRSIRNSSSACVVMPGLVQGINVPSRGRDRPLRQICSHSHSKTVARWPWKTRP